MRLRRKSPFRHRGVTVTLDFAKQRVPIVYMSHRATEADLKLVEDWLTELQPDFEEIATAVSDILSQREAEK